MYRIGNSTDIHELVLGRELILGGVKIDHEYGLKGHSDADVVLHAIGEAIIGALGLGDLGRHFPDTDDRFRGVDSMYLLSCINEMMLERGYRVVNIDTTVLTQKPKLAPYIRYMEKNVANCLNIACELVNIKATTGENIGFVGRCEGIAAQAVVLLVRQGG